MKPRTVLSMEQALSMPYATLRFVHLGWRVIRLEAMTPGQELPGDPNRYIGFGGSSLDRAGMTWVFPVQVVPILFWTASSLIPMPVRK